MVDTKSHWYLQTHIDAYEPFCDYNSLATLVHFTKVKHYRDGFTKYKHLKTWKIEKYV